jgi:hypothetical protein
LVTGESILDKLPVTKFTTIQAMNVTSTFVPMLFDEIRGRKVLRNIRNDFDNGRCCICHKRKRTSEVISLLNQQAIICKHCNGKEELLFDGFSINRLISSDELFEYFTGKNGGLFEYFTGKNGGLLTSEQASFVIELFSKWLNIKWKVSNGYI